MSIQQVAKQDNVFVTDKDLRCGNILLALKVLLVVSSTSL